MIKLKKANSNITVELSNDEMLDVITYLRKFHHYACLDTKLLPDVKRDFMKKSFILSEALMPLVEYEKWKIKRTYKLKSKH